MICALFMKVDVPIDNREALPTFPHYWDILREDMIKREIQRNSHRFDIASSTSSSFSSYSSFFFLKVLHAMILFFFHNLDVITVVCCHVTSVL